MTNATGENSRNRKSGTGGKTAVNVGEVSKGIPRPAVDSYDASVRAGATPNYGGGRKGTPPMGKEKTDKDSGILDEGHSNHMSGPNHAGPQEAGQSAPGGAKKSTKDNLGGNGRMFAQMYAGPQQPGQSAAGGAFNKANERFTVEGGKGSNNHMFGKGTASPARPS